MAGGLYYEHSGKWSLSGPPAGLIKGILAGVPMAFIYAYLQLYIQFIPVIRGIVSLFDPFAFGMAVGGITGLALKGHKVRNVAITKVVSVLAALVSIYASWVFWTYAFFHRVGSRVTLLPLILDPHLLWTAIGKINEVGWWEYRGMKPTGIFLWICWGIEAVVIAGTAMVVGALGPGDVFCESCEVWCKKEEGACKAKAADRAEVKQRLESKDFGYLEKLGAAEPGATAWVRLDICSCPTCRATNTLSASSISVTVDKQGKKTEATVSLISNLLVSSSEADTIRQIGQKLGASPASASS